jgi:hypothetical protein
MLFYTHERTQIKHNTTKQTFCVHNSLQGEQITHLALQSHQKEQKHQGQERMLVLEQRLLLLMQNWRLRQVYMVDSRVTMIVLANHILEHPSSFPPQQHKVALTIFWRVGQMAQPNFYTQGVGIIIDDAIFIEFVSLVTLTILAMLTTY